MAVQLSVKHFGGGEYKLEADLDNATVSEVKRVLASQDQSGIPIDDQILVYNGVTLSDTQTLREGGVEGDRFKLILGSKSSTPSSETRGEGDVVSASLASSTSATSVRLKYDFKDHYSLDDLAKMGTFIWKRLNDLSSSVSYDHLEKVASESWQIHQKVLMERRESYFKTFLAHTENHQTPQS